MIVKGPNDTEILQGQNAILDCVARGHPTPKVVWAMGGNGDKPIPPDSRFVIMPGGSLLIQNAKMKDAGIYQCIAINGAGSDSAGAIIRVKGR